MLWLTRQYLLAEVQAGMILARPIVSGDRNILLNENTVLTQTTLDLLKAWGVQSLHIKEIIREDGVNAYGFVAGREKFLARYEENILVLKDVFETARYLREAPVKKIEALADRTVDMLSGATGVISHLSSLPPADDYTLRHSLNVGILAGLLGRWRKVGIKTLREVVLAGLLHDIGKTQVPLEILNSPGPLSAAEMAIMQQHPVRGYKLLEDNDRLAQSVKFAVLQHHERLDGSGYPAALAGDAIADYARLIAVTDMYDAMTSSQVYREAFTPFASAAEIFAMFDKLDPAVALPFIANIRDAMIGRMVKLSDGTEARVIYLDTERLSRPVVRLARGGYVDLEKRRDLTITGLVAG